MTAVKGREYVEESRKWLILSIQFGMIQERGDIVRVQAT